MNNPAQNRRDQLSTTTEAGVVMEGKVDTIRRIDGLITLLQDVKTGIQMETDKEAVLADGYRALKEIRELVQEVAK